MVTREKYEYVHIYLKQGSLHQFGKRNNNGTINATAVTSNSADTHVERLRGVAVVGQLVLVESLKMVSLVDGILQLPVQRLNLMAGLLVQLLFSNGEHTQSDSPRMILLCSHNFTCSV